MKKIAFVSTVLFGSLILLQYVLIQPMFETSSSITPKPETLVVQPVRYQISTNEKVVVIYKDGQYFVYQKYLPSI